MSIDCPKSLFRDYELQTNSVGTLGYPSSFFYSAVPTLHLREWMSGTAKSRLAGRYSTGSRISGC
jgi:hypothetical protein